MSTPAPWFDWETGAWIREPKTLLANYEDACLIAASPLFKEACSGTGTPGEPTPLDALDHLLSTADADKRDVEAVERLARELRAALGRAEAP